VRDGRYLTRRDPRHSGRLQPLRGYCAWYESSTTQWLYARVRPGRAPRRTAERVSEPLAVRILPSGDSLQNFRGGA